MRRYLDEDFTFTKKDMKTITLLAIFFLCKVMHGQSTDSGMVLIPGGDYIMGKNSGNPTDWQPEHRVSVNSFYMDQYEVTNRKYYEFCMSTDNPLPEFWGSSQFRCSPDYPDYPVVGVSYSDAEKYARWAGKRLPTEAEWEYASRGGLQNKNFPWGDQIDSTRANYGKKYGSTLRVGTFEPNSYGLYDISGNVWEWTSDFYGESYYTESPDKNPIGPGHGRFKVIRGGSWHSGGMCQQTYYRNGLPVSWVDFAVGFRCVRDI